MKTEVSCSGRHLELLWQHAPWSLPCMLPWQSHKLPHCELLTGKPMELRVAQITHNLIFHKLNMINNPVILSPFTNSHSWLSQAFI